MEQVAPAARDRLLKKHPKPLAQGPSFKKISAQRYKLFKKFSVPVSKESAAQDTPCTGIESAAQDTS
jgi:hypothetical protein